jgi:hypothetical protein
MAGESTGSQRLVLSHPRSKDARHNALGRAAGIEE